MSVHVVDVSRGIVASGMQIEVFTLAADDRRLLVNGVISAKGTLDHPALDALLTAGSYEPCSTSASTTEQAKVELPSVPFLDVVTYRFGIADPRQHYHLPFKCTPWGYSCFRGGA
jgi:5-hydroxyisourate hydrolase